MNCIDQVQLLGMTGNELSAIYQKEKAKHIKKGKEVFSAWKKSLVEELESHESGLNQEVLSGAPRVTVLRRMGSNFSEHVSNSLPTNSFISTLGID